MTSVDPYLSFVKPIGFTTAILGLIQGTFWISLNVLAASIYLEIWKPTLLDPFAFPRTYGQIISWTIGRAYLKADTKLAVEVFVTSTTLFGWTVMYLLLSIIWILISALQFDMLWEQKHKNLRKIFLSWAFCTSVISLVDFILTILLAADYAIIVHAINEGTLGNVSLPLACGILISLAAKGFVLWIFNVIFIVLIIILSLKLSRHPEISQDMNQTNSNDNSDNNSDSFGTVKLYGNPTYNWEKERPKFNQNGFYSSLWYYRRGQNDVETAPSTSKTSKHLAQKQTAKSTPGSISSTVPEASYSYPTQPKAPTPEPDYTGPTKHAVRTRYNIYS